MTTPNEELRKQLQQIYKSGELYYRVISDTTDLLQSQAERTASLESLNELAVKQAETLVKQRDALRAELDALRGQEPVIDFTVLHQFAEQQAISYNKLCTAVHLAAAAQPALDVAELVEAFEHHIEQTRPIERSTIALSKYKGAKQ